MPFRHSVGKEHAEKWRTRARKKQRKRAKPTLGLPSALVVSSPKSPFRPDSTLQTFVSGVPPPRVVDSRFSKNFLYIFFILFYFYLFIYLFFCFSLSLFLSLFFSLSFSLSLSLSLSFSFSFHSAATCLKKIRKPNRETTGSLPGCERSYAYMYIIIIFFYYLYLYLYLYIYIYICITRTATRASLHDAQLSILLSPFCYNQLESP